jgi:hypothetical protein
MAGDYLRCMSTFSSSSSGPVGLIALGSDGIAYKWTPTPTDFGQSTNTAGTWTAISNAGVTAPLVSVAAGSNYITATDTAGLVFILSPVTGAWAALPAHP